MVTHSSTSRPVQCLCMAERTGCPVLTDLWSYVLFIFLMGITQYGLLTTTIKRPGKIEAEPKPGEESFERDTSVTSTRTLRK
jgi:energy-converting hydrogenase Eha subunit H